MFIFLLLPLASSSKCRALTMQGGGVHGAYEAGVLQGLIDNLPPEETAWDFLTGVSIGSCNTVFASQFKVGEEQGMKDYILDIWGNFTDYSQFFTFWDCDPLCWIFNKPGLLNNAPLADLLNENAKGPIQRPISCGTTDLNTGEFVTFDESLGIQDYIKASVSSAAVQAAFPHQNVLGGVFVDGGVTFAMDSFTPIARCLKRGVSEEDIEIDMMLDFNVVDYQTDTDNMNTFDVLEKVADVGKVDHNLQYVLYAESSYPKVNFRYVIAPSQSLGSTNFFTPEKLQWMIKLGYSDALDVIAHGSNIDLIRKYAKERDDIVYAQQFINQFLKNYLYNILTQFVECVGYQILCDTESDFYKIIAVNSQTQWIFGANLNAVDMQYF